MQPNLYKVVYYQWLIEVPFPLRISRQLLDALLFNLRCQHRTKSIPPKPDCFVADIDPTLVQKVLYISKRKWEPDIHHYRKANDLWTCLKVTKGAVICHETTLDSHPHQLKGGLIWQCRQKNECEPTIRSCMSWNHHVCFHPGHH